MALDPKKRQKKLEKQKAKHKAKHHQLVKEKNVGLSQPLVRAAAAPLLECLRMAALFEQGIGQVIVSRQMSDGTIAVGVFLVDMYCLGVKDAFGRFVSRFEYNTKLSGSSQFPMVPVEPAAARKLVEGAVAYARELGFAPHPDYQATRVIFGDIDASQCQEEFTYGLNGKPHFISGPNDTPARCRQIMAILERNRGPGNFDYLVAIPSDTLIEPLEEPELDF